MDDETAIMDRVLHRHNRADGWFRGIAMDPHPRIVALALALAILESEAVNQEGSST
jgi:hypothetical protein